MDILAHRGCWTNPEEKNTKEALQRAFKKGYGIETDIRDYKGELVISHNVAGEDAYLLEAVLADYKMLEASGPLAINIKADGLQELLEFLLKKYDISNYFVFDMSNPEMVVYRRKKIRYFTRLSDIESQAVLYEDADGVWVDGIYSYDWLSEDILGKLCADDKRIGLISPELHGRDKSGLWKLLKDSSLYLEENIMLCTDVPEEAREYFG